MFFVCFVIKPTSKFAFSTPFVSNDGASLWLFVDFFFRRRNFLDE